MVDYALVVNNLTKSFNDVSAVNGISFKLKTGEILGLLGPNGAGKTTTIHMLLGLTSPTFGEIKYFDKDFFKNSEYCKQRINFASSYSQVQGRITIKQNLRIYAGLYGIKDYKKRIDEVAKLLNIEQFMDTVYYHLSSGQRTRVILAKALINKPKLILMDEPTSSLDPEVKNDVLDLIRHLQKKENVSILFTSHDMEEVSRICDRVMFLSKGKIIANDTPLGLTKMIGNNTLTLTFDGDHKIVKNYFDEKKFNHKFIRKQIVDVNVPEEKIPKVLFGLSNKNIWITSIDIKKPHLEDVFLSIAKRDKEKNES
jgi:ABC-2 type transport system ATP-binding protein